MNGFFDFSKDGFGFVDSLKVMLLGLIIIFVVTGVLILCVAALNKINAGSKRYAYRRNPGKNNKIYFLLSLQHTSIQSEQSPLVHAKNSAVYAEFSFCFYNCFNNLGFNSVRFRGRFSPVPPQFRRI